MFKDINNIVVDNNKLEFNMNTTTVIIINKNDFQENVKNDNSQVNVKNVIPEE